jgi:hypothetical protein
MFKKDNNNKAADPLADRMRKIAAVPAEEVTYSSVQTGQKRAERKPTFKSATVTTLGGDLVDFVVNNFCGSGDRL